VRQVEPDREALLGYLAANREAVLLIVEGLSEVQLRQPAVPSGWTPIGLIEHLADAERFWLQSVVTGVQAPSPWPKIASNDPESGFVSDHAIAEVVAYYRATWTSSDAVLARFGLDDAPVAELPDDLVDIGRSVRSIVLHVIEETARHAGHLDIARELIDGRTGLGPR
jgi:uncharacterized damage-inducible protein DinB